MQDRFQPQANANQSKTKLKAGILGGLLGAAGAAISWLVPRENDNRYRVFTDNPHELIPYKTNRVPVAFAVGASVALVSTFLAYKFLKRRSNNDLPPEQKSDSSHIERLQDASAQATQFTVAGQTPRGYVSCH